MQARNHAFTKVTTRERRGGNRFESYLEGRMEVEQVKAEKTTLFFLELVREGKRWRGKHTETQSMDELH